MKKRNENKVLAGTVVAAVECRAVYGRQVGKPDV